MYETNMGRWAVFTAFGQTLYFNSQADAAEFYLEHKDLCVDRPGGYFADDGQLDMFTDNEEDN